MCSKNKNNFSEGCGVLLFVAVWLRSACSLVFGCVLFDVFCVVLSFYCLLVFSARLVFVVLWLVRCQGCALCLGLPLLAVCFVVCKKNSSRLFLVVACCFRLKSVCFIVENKNNEACVVAVFVGLRAVVVCCGYIL